MGLVNFIKKVWGNGDTLDAPQLNRIENGVDDCANACNTLSEDLATANSAIQTNADNIATNTSDINELNDNLSAFKNMGDSGNSMKVFNYTFPKSNKCQMYLIFAAHPKNSQESAVYLINTLNEFMTVVPVLKSVNQTVTTNGLALTITSSVYSAFFTIYRIESFF